MPCEHLFDISCVDALVAYVRGGPMSGTSHLTVFLADGNQGITLGVDYLGVSDAPWLSHVGRVHP